MCAHKQISNITSITFPFYQIMNLIDTLCVYICTYTHIRQKLLPYCGLSCFNYCVSFSFIYRYTCTYTFYATAHVVQNMHLDIGYLIKNLYIFDAISFDCCNITKKKNVWIYVKLSRFITFNGGFCCKKKNKL